MEDNQFSTTTKLSANVFLNATGATAGDDVLAETVNLNTFKSSQCNNYTFFLTGAGSFNSSGGTLVNAIDRGSGAIVTYDLNDLFTFKVGYLGENTEFLPAAFFLYLFQSQ